MEGLWTVSGTGTKEITTTYYFFILSNSSSTIGFVILDIPALIFSVKLAHYHPEPSIDKLRKELAKKRIEIRL